MARIFLTGATGYVGGEVLHHIKHSTLTGLQVACLVRDADKAKKLKSAYPDVDIVQGGLDDGDTIEREARAADVVLSTYSVIWK